MEDNFRTCFLHLISSLQLSPQIAALLLQRILGILSSNFDEQNEKT